MYKLTKINDSNLVLTGNKQADIKEAVRSFAAAV